MASRPDLSHPHPTPIQCVTIVLLNGKKSDYCQLQSQIAQRRRLENWRKLSLREIARAGIIVGATRNLGPIETCLTDVLSNHMNTTWKFSILNVTYMTAQRKDGHSSLYYLGPIESPAPLHRQDCSHWCLPEVPDSWNKLLFALFLKRKATTHGLNSSMHRARI
ncbi:hypothetical protein LWI29_029510 [Acer saccharum]|uniref:Trichome birefringence-like C-terminal domain-containing protein n=1 Tax=Acer saccharum TaxID=4024 RepID=A0AA39TND4_ACESA|nr:hypothetical protein LWI29_029510 [Acer saccharum]